jgi:hypothetical protein
MYEIDTSSLMAYIQTILSLVGGVLRLDPAVFQMVNQVGTRDLILFWIVLIAGMSWMIGQSIVLFANRVKPGRFFIAVFLGGLRFLLEVALVGITVGLLGLWLGRIEIDFVRTFQTVSLAYAPYWLAFLVLIPYFGLIIERLLKVYLFLTLVVALQVAFQAPFGLAVIQALIVFGIAALVNLVLGRLLTPLANVLTRYVSGGEDDQLYQKLHEMFQQQSQPVPANQAAPANRSAQK